jgi:hypothetical protein
MPNGIYSRKCKKQKHDKTARQKKRSWRNVRKKELVSYLGRQEGHRYGGREFIW